MLRTTEAQAVPGSAVQLLDLPADFAVPVSEAFGTIPRNIRLMPLIAETLRTQLPHSVWVRIPEMKRRFARIRT